jgi:hypothetical protein
MSRSSSKPYRLTQLKASVEKHREMLESGNLSVSPEIGGSVVIHSGYGNAEERETLNQHSDDLISRAGAFLGATVLRRPTSETISEVLKDPDIVNISFIGHGSFSTFYFGKSVDTRIPITWLDISKTSTHLKQGVIEQRTCTTIPNPLKEVRVAMPSFIIADQTKIIGSVNKIFDEMHGYEVITPMLGKVYEQPLNSADELRRPIGFNIEI